MHLVTELDTDTGTVFAKNPYNSEIPERVGFFDVDEVSRSF